MTPTEIDFDRLKPNTIVQGTLFPEPVQVITTIPMGQSIKLIGKGLQTQKVYEPILNPQQLTQLQIIPEHEPFNGNPQNFRLGVEALRWGLAHEYDPYFSLAIARVDPLPHQLEAVYDYFLKLARIRFLLADDPGAGKTVMAGLLLKELKIRGLVQRTLIIAPANLTFQWQREMKDKFREDFEVVKGDILRANYGQNPWQEKNQVVASVSWVSRIPDAKDSLLRSHWDLIIVDEAHKMSAYSSDKKTLAYQLGERLSEMTDHYLLMTATPHKGDPDNFRLFLELLDPDVYGDIKSLEEAMKRNVAPFYLRRTKEALVTFPEPETGQVQKLFTNRTVKTSEREFREDCQVLVATEAAGEGINLQFCWFMINYDIPWNPVRLEQRMGRIHRYGQDKDCLIFNFVATNTREGRVLWKLFERIEAIERDLDPEQTGKVFNVLGDIFPANQLERMLREMYAKNLTEDSIKDRIVEQVNLNEFRKITHSTLEGLAKKSLNLSKLIGQSVEAKERRLVPESIEYFFLEAATVAGIHPKEVRKNSHTYRVGKIPRTLWSVGDRLEPRYGKLGRDYKQIIFDKDRLKDDPTLEWVTPGHPLFETVREKVWEEVQDDLRRGAIFYDLHRSEPSGLDVFSATIQDGRGRILHRRLFVVETAMNGTFYIRQPTIFLDFTLADPDTLPPENLTLPERQQVEQTLIEQALQPFLTEIQSQRQKEVEIIIRHTEISLTNIIDRVQRQFAELSMQKESESKEIGLEGRLKQMEDRLFERNGRLESRREQLKQEKNCTITDIQHHGRAWVLPHPQRHSPELATMVSNQEIERIAIQTVIEYEQARGWQVESVETENRGFDLISRKPHPEDSQTAIAVRFIEVKGRSQVGEVALTTNEYKTAERLKQDYWLYVVFNCATTPTVYPIPDPVKLGWQPLVKIEHYQLEPSEILERFPKNYPEKD
ncbi:protein NO VEIN domain-containing protein [Planktothrix pseudagardhii]|uniref:RNA polymerase-associated protein RapA n=1 Tax=Planktothrix pseudagardhii TaxID=132604 RepID=A0A9W4DFJ1_9CYAN|nr:DUF3883 domain-containing protein [Planktothrix pseudagardhii]CAD5988472.1 RNA polymerase-associated protein RapA [Planktothrix pseudagardhii]